VSPHTAGMDERASNFSESHDDDILSPTETRQKCGNLSTTTLWRMRQRGEFPEAVRLSPGRIGWRHSDIKTWQRQRTVVIR